MKKRRPTAYERDVVDWLRAMKPGAWKIEVEDMTAAASGFGLAEVKHEGSIAMHFEKITVRIWPLSVRR